MPVVSPGRRLAVAALAALALAARCNDCGPTSPTGPCQTDCHPEGVSCDPGAYCCADAAGGCCFIGDSCEVDEGGEPFCAGPLPDPSDLARAARRVKSPRRFGP